MSHTLTLLEPFLTLFISSHFIHTFHTTFHTGAGLTYTDTKESIGRLLDEFSASRDVEEAARCLRALNVPFFHHEVCADSGDFWRFVNSFCQFLAMSCLFFHHDGCGFQAVFLAVLPALFNI